MVEPARAPLLQQRAFRSLSFSRFTSRLAQNAINFGLVLLIVDETGKVFLSSLLVLALVVPSTAAGIVAGVAADALPKRLVLFLGNVVRAVVCVLFVRGSGDVASFYVVAISLATATQFATAAEGSLTPLIVPKSDLAHANAINQAVGGGAQLLGLGVLTPVVLRVFDSPEILFGIAAGLFLVAAAQAVLIGGVQGPERREVGGDTPGAWWSAGWRQMRSDPAVMHAALELTVISAALIVLAGLIPKYIEDVLGLPIDVGAVVLMPAAAGVVAGLRIAGALSRRLPHGFLSTVGFGLFVVLLAMLTFVSEEAEFLGGYGAFEWLNDVNIGSFDSSGVLAMAIMLPLGFAYAVVSVAAQTVLNDRVPLHLQGRVLATQGAMAAIASSAPVLGAGALGDLIGVTPVMALLAGGVALVSVATLQQNGSPPAGRVAMANEVH